MRRAPGRYSRPPVVVVLALALAACGEGGEPAGEVSDADTATGRIAQPPSATAPRAALPGGAPDTVRPAPDTLAEVVPQPGARRRAAEEIDLGAIIAGYRRYYTELFYEEGSDVRGGIDPALERDAKRRVALDWGYVDTGAWSDLVADLARDQRVVLADRIEAANRELASQLHGAPR